MAHPKLSTLINRSVLTVSTAALLAGPLAASASAQVDLDVEDVDCEALRALPTDQLPGGVLPEECVLESEPVEDAKESGKKAAEDGKKAAEDGKKAVEDAVSDEPSDKPSDKPSDSPSEPSSQGGVPLPSGSGGGETPNTPTGTVNPPKTSGGQQRPAGDNVSPIDQGSSGGRTVPAGDERRYNESSASFNSQQAWGGYGTTSTLTLQPFDAPVVSVPPVYELPKVAAALLGRDAATAAAATPDVVAASSTGAPLINGMPTSSTGVPVGADVPAWLLATSTGLLVIVGAAHFVNATNKAFQPR